MLLFCVSLLVFGELASVLAFLGLFGRRCFFWGVFMRVLTCALSVYVFMCTFVCVFMFVFVCVFMFVLVCVFMFVLVCVFMFVLVCVFMFVLVCVFMNILE